MSRLLFVVLLSLMLWLPWPLGSNRLWSVSLAEIVIFSLGIGWLIQYWRGRAEITPAFRAAWPMLTLWALWSAWLVFQILPLPAGWVELISPAAYALNRAAEPLTGAAATMTLSLDPYATRGLVILTCAYALLFCLVLLLVDSRERVRTLATVLVISGLLQALFGTLVVLSGMNIELFGAQVSKGVASGSFPNRNHFAHYLGLCLSVGIGLLLADLGNWNAGTWRAWVRQFIELLFSRKMRLRVFLAIMVIALVLTRSRMGNTAFFTSLTVMGALFVVLKHRRLGKPALILFGSLFLVDLWILGSWFGLDEVVQRLERTEIAKEQRTHIVKASGEQLLDYKLTGSGLGTFYTTFPRYRPPKIFGFIKFAENDYVQFFSEVGAVGTVLLGAMVLVTVWVSFKAMIKRRDRLLVGMGFSALMAMLTIAIHSSSDFNLQIPSNAATLITIMALGWTAFGLPSGRTRSRRRPDSRGLGSPQP